MYVCAIYVQTLPQVHLANTGLALGDKGEPYRGNRLGQESTIVNSPPPSYEDVHKKYNVNNDSWLHIHL